MIYNKMYFSRINSKVKSVKMKKLVLSTLFMAIAASVYCQTQMSLPVSFQETNVNYNLVGF